MHLVSVRTLYTSEQHPYMHLVSVLCIPVSSIPTSLSFLKSFCPCFHSFFVTDLCTLQNYKQTLYTYPLYRHDVHSGWSTCV